MKPDPDPSKRPVALLAFGDDYRRQIFGPEEEARLARLVTPVSIDLRVSAAPLPGAARIMLTGWPTPRLIPEILAAMPQLGLVTHAAGSIKPIMPAEGFPAGLIVTNCVAQNAIPVAEYALAAILLANKRILALGLTYREMRQGRKAVLANSQALGNYRRTVGLVGASTIGRLVADMLRPFDLEVIVADPYLSEADAAEMGVTKVTLAHLFENADTVSLHAPLLPDTRHMINASLIDAMKPGATLINTARGALVDEEALIAALQREQIYAIIDTTWPEVPEANSPLWTLPNLLLTPHIAGATSLEIRRFGVAVIDSIEAFLEGRPVPGQVSFDQLDRLA
ncbi:hydroxyacid dehydrogenase [Devosia sediminis]|uniref:Hydroxyacid dehydrogenase n=1 Tax=Devosia sediminis TaxID=2798801 RepID=A0A934IZT2_9HYPH|nr:hydroxyacid dehydrogenase [Devosia sediminis]MBJ3784979.1 hydroxyacid dehydrogenase [Devosia sediminis]